MEAQNSEQMSQLHVFFSLDMSVSAVESIGFLLVAYAFNARCLFINLCTYLDNGVSTFFRDLPSPRSFGMQQIVYFLLTR